MGGAISWGPSLKKKFQAFGPQSGLKIRGRSLTSRYSVMVANPFPVKKFGLGHC